MKDIFGWIGKVLGLAFGVLVVGYTAYLTYLLAARLVPDNTILQFMTVALFDLGAFVWFVLFLTTAKGTGQWGVAGIGFMVGLAGAIIMAGGELLLSQNLVVVEDVEQLGWLLIATVIVAALTHASLTYLFHYLSPAVKNRIENEQKISKVVEKAYESARAEIDRQADAMGADVAASLVYEARAQLASMALPHLRRGADLETKAQEAYRGGLVIPGNVIDPARKNGDKARIYAADVEAVGGAADVPTERKAKQ